MRPQYSAPLNGSSDLACMALNISNEVVPITIELFLLDGSPQAGTGPTDADPAAGLIRTRTLSGINYCKISRDGKPDDIRASFCWGAGC